MEQEQEVESSPLPFGDAWLQRMQQGNVEGTLRELPNPHFTQAYKAQCENLRKAHLGQWACLSPDLL